MKNADQMTELETLFLALADRTRIRLLHLMRDGEVCVQSLTAVLGESQPKISRHLAYLRSAGLVEARRDGKWIHYRIAALGAPAARVIGAALECLASENDPPPGGREPADAPGRAPSTATKPAAFAPQTFGNADMSVEKRDELEVHLL